MTPNTRSILLISATCATLAVACGTPAPEEVDTETVVPVTIEAAQVGTIRAVIHTTGVVEPAPGADLTVTAPAAARIAEMPNAEGDRVRRGDLLVRFEIPSLTAELAGKSAEVNRAEARLLTVKAAQTRAHDLFDRGVAARKDMEDADRERADAEAALTEAHAGHSASNTLAERAIVRATFDGIVARRVHNPGDLVEASAGDPILRVIDPSRLEVDAWVPLADVSRIRVGAVAHLAAASDEEFEVLKVVSRPAAVEPGTAAVPVRLAFERPTGLAAGTPVQVDIEADQHASVVLARVEAVVHEGNETAVFVAVDGKAQRRTVVTGLSDGRFVEMRSGLTAGELVITRGQAGLPDGTSIRVAPAEQ